MRLSLVPLVMAVACGEARREEPTSVGEPPRVGTPFLWALRSEQPPEMAVPMPKGDWRPKVGGRYSDFDGLIEHYAGVRHLPGAYVRAVIDVESDFDPKAVSPAGAAGLMQLMAKTAQGLGVRDRHDPTDNVAGGTLYLRRLADRFGGSLVLTTAAYNAGPGAVEKHGGVPPFRETRRYVGKVLRRYRAYRALERQEIKTAEGNGGIKMEGES